MLRSSFPGLRLSFWAIVRFLNPSTTRSPLDGIAAIVDRLAFFVLSGLFFLFFLADLYTTFSSILLTLGIPQAHRYHTPPVLTASGTLTN